MLALDRTQSSLSTHPNAPQMQHRPSNSRSESFDLPPRSRSTPPFQSHHSAIGATLPTSQPSSHHQYSSQHDHHLSHQQSHPMASLPFQQFPGHQAGHPGFYPNQFQPGGMGGYGGMGGVGFNHQQQLFQQQQHLAGWAAAFQHQQMMMNGGTPPISPFPSPSPYGNPNDHQRPPPHLDGHRRRTSSGPTHPTHSQQSSNPAYHSKPQSQVSSSQPPSSTRHQSSAFSPSSTPASSQSSEQPGGFHPYRRPDKRSGALSSRDTSVSSVAAGEPVLPPSRPYVRAEAPRSDSSVNSAHSSNKSRAERDRERERDRGMEQEILAPPRSSPRNGPRKDEHNRQASASSSIGGHSSGGSFSSVHGPPKLSSSHSDRKESFSSDRPNVQQPNTHRTHSSSSSAPTATPGTNNGPSPAIGRPNSPSNGPAASKQPSKPSPLSQQQAAPAREPEKAKKPIPSSAALPTPPPIATVPVKEKSGGLKGMFGKKKKDSLAAAPPTPTMTPAITPSAAKTLPTSGSLSNLRSAAAAPSTSSPTSTFSTAPGIPFTSAALSDNAQTTGQPKKSRSLFNMKNASTDNISIASAASSASMMIRKIGSFGKLAKRNSMSGISSMFKDKEKKAKDTDDLPSESGKKKSALFRSGKKGVAPPPSVTHAAIEHDRDQDQAIGGLSPAAALARQHTLRSKAAEQERRAAASGATVDDAGRRMSSDVPPTWEKNTATRHGELARQSGEYSRHGASISDELDTKSIMDSEEENDYGEVSPADGAMEEARARFGAVGLDDPSDEWDRWGVTSVIRPEARPKKGILKSVSSYSADPHLDAPEPVWNRMRSNSTEQTPHSTSSSHPTPLALIPSTDPDHIDGLSHHHPPRSPNAKEGNHPSFASDTHDPFSPSFSPFESTISTSNDESSRLSFPYANPTHNSSAPALSHFPSLSGGANEGGHGGMGQRSITAPAQRREIVWSESCAVYLTHSPLDYDRSSEPATCNRLTPQLAAEIKAFLNEFKLSEMSVHPASARNTQFFA